LAENHFDHGFCLADVLSSRFSRGGASPVCVLPPCCQNYVAQQ
jgi:hypothetical protein